VAVLVSDILEIFPGSREAEGRDLTSLREQTNQQPEKLIPTRRCRNTRVKIKFLDSSTGQLHEAYGRCKQNTCPDCAQINQQNLRKLLITVVKDYFKTNHIPPAKSEFNALFITQTVGGRSYREANSPKDATKLLLQGISMLKRLLRKRLGIEDFIWSMEPQQDGYPHWHGIVLSPGVKRNAVKNIVAEVKNKLGLGFKDVDGIKQPLKAAHYIVKYLSKGSTSGHVKGSHTWGMSRSLRSRVSATQKLSHGRYQVVALSRVDDDGNDGSTIWRLGDTPRISEEQRQKLLGAWLAELYDGSRSLPIDLPFLTASSTAQGVVWIKHDRGL